MDSPRLVGVRRQNNVYSISDRGNMPEEKTGGDIEMVSVDADRTYGAQHSNGTTPPRRPTSAGDAGSPAVQVEEDDIREESLTLTRHLLSGWYILVAFLVPVLLLPLVFSLGDDFKAQGRCAYVLIVMAVLWASEALPLAVTSLLPIVLLPVLGVMKASEVSAQYMGDPFMLFVGGLIVAIAIEVQGVHLRIALLVLKTVGAEPKRLLLGISLVTWFLSMWISNTAATAMMMTIVNALLVQFRTIDREMIQLKYSGADSSQIEEKKADEREAEEKNRRLGKAVSLSVAYAANIGGVGSLTGSGPNLVLFAAARDLFNDYGMTSPVTFGTWMVMGFPLSLLAVLVMWLWMVAFYLRCRGCCLVCGYGEKDDEETIQRVNKTIEDEYTKLGSVTYAQKSVLCCFGLLVIAWVTRDLGGSGGWQDWFPEGFVTDSTPSIFVSVLLFVLPSELPKAFRNKFDKRESYSSIKPLLNWSHLKDKMPWGVFWLLGGGFAMATASVKSGLSEWMGGRLLVFQDLNHWAIVLIIAYIVTFTTEITSNTATATLLMPILRQMALSMEVNPLFFMYPAAISCSFAFMLPVATPANAIVYSHGNVKVVDMAKTGLFLNLVCVPLLMFATATWGNALFHFDQMPDAFLGNATLPRVVAA